MNPYEHTSINRAMTFEAACGYGCNMTMVMNEYSFGHDRPANEIVDNEGNEVDDDKIERELAQEFFAQYEDQCRHEDAEIRQEAGDILNEQRKSKEETQ